MKFLHYCVRMILLLMVGPVVSLYKMKSMKTFKHNS